jgi:tetratricopeptide (TPR) repeat protein
MLLLPQSNYTARQRLASDLAAQKMTHESFFQELLKLDPDDFIALVGMGKLVTDGGDFAGAERYFWRAIQANPCSAEAYVDLGRLYYREPETRVLALALAELGILKQSREEDDDEFLKDVDYEDAGISADVLEKFRDLPAPLQGKVVTRSLRENHDKEPEDVTERLRPLRLIEEMLADGELDSGTVDAMIAEGPSIVPLLVGVMRAWAQDYLDEDEDVDLENALALLGETGSPAEIRHLMEFVGLENGVASGASSWALGRIIERFPVESARFIESIAAGLGSAERLKVAEMAMRHPAFDPDGRLLARLGENIEWMSQEDRDGFVPLLIGAMAGARGSAGINIGRSVLRRQSGLLSRGARRESEDYLDLFGHGGIAPRPPGVSPWTVYDICAGQATWGGDGEDDEEEDDEFLPPPEPIRNAPKPGRNDPCWCNSGRKYKKCHLEADERGSK